MKLRTHPIRTAVLCLAILATASSCGDYALNPTADISPTCPTGLAQIRIADSFTQVLCGCKLEASGTISQAGTPLSCTVDAGTKVIFHFEGTFQRHQIVPAPGAPFFISMAPRIPDDSNAQSAYFVTFSTPATTFQFIDQYLPELKGNIVVL